MRPSSDQPPQDNVVRRASQCLKRLMTRSTCAQFLIRIIPPLLLFTLVFIALFGFNIRQKVRREIHHEVETYTTALSQVVDDLMWNFQKGELASALSTISSNKAMVGAELYDARGDLYLSHGTDSFKDNPANIIVQKKLYKIKSDGSREDLGRLLIYYNFNHADERILNDFLGQIVRFLFIIFILAVTVFFAYQQVIGTPLRILLRAIRATDSHGSPAHANWDSSDEIGEVIAAHNRMVTHLAEKESALAESEQRYRELYDNALVGIFNIRPDGTLQDANRTVAEIMGFSSVADMGSGNIIDHYQNPKDRTRLWQNLSETGTVSHFRMQLLKADGTKFWAEVSGRLRPGGTFNGILQDVTTEEEAKRAMAERDELHRAFFEENKAVMLLHDPRDSSIQFVNPAACLFYGYTEDELTSMTLHDLNRMSDDELFEEFKRATSERRGYFKQTHTLKNGVKRNVEVFTGPISMRDRQLHYSIVHDVTEKRRLESRLERMATRDQLTGAYNRHAFFDRGKEEIARANRFTHPLAVLMFDLDHFKLVNDEYGHATGDEVLRVFALRCRADLRNIDVFSRLGGEEFAALLVETSEEKAMQVAERIRNIAQNKPIPTEKGDLTVTTSVGMAILQNGDNMAEILKRADKGLYMAKNSGRNIVCKV